MKPPSAELLQIPPWAPGLSHRQGMIPPLPGEKYTPATKIEKLSVQKSALQSTPKSAGYLGLPWRLLSCPCTGGRERDSSWFTSSRPRKALGFPAPARQEIAPVPGSSQKPAPEPKKCRITKCRQPCRGEGEHWLAQLDTSTRSRGMSG